MKVFVIGGTGLVGSYLLPTLIERGDEVYALTRSENKTGNLESMGCHAIVGDIRSPETFRKFLPENPEIIVLLAMPGVRPGRRMTMRIKAELRRETNDFFRNAMDLAVFYDIPVILPGGTSYRTQKDEVADETWPVLRVGLTEIGADTDAMVNEAIKNKHPKIIQLIYGKIYGNGGLFRFIYNMMEKGRSRIIGKGDNYIPNIHAADAASAIVKAIEKQPVGEKFIIADDVPVTLKDFTIYMAELMGKKQPGHIPGFIIRQIIGRDFYSVISMNCRVTNEKAKKMLGWQPQYPSYIEGLKAVINEIQGKE